MEHMFSVEATVPTAHLPAYAVLAEEILEDSIFSLNSPFRLGKVVLKLKIL